MFMVPITQSHPESYADASARMHAHTYATNQGINCHETEVILILVFHVIFKGWNDDCAIGSQLPSFSKRFHPFQTSR